MQSNFIEVILLQNNKFIVIHQISGPMTSSGASSDVTFCLHFNSDLTFFQRKLFELNLRKISSFNFEIQENQNCIGSICLYCSQTVFLNSLFLQKLIEVFNSKEADVIYSDYRTFNLFSRKFWNSNFLPMWSPIRFWYLNYLGPVVAVNSSKLGIKRGLSYEELVEIILNSKTSKINKINYKLLSKVKHPSELIHFEAIKNYLQNNLPKVTISLSSSNRIQISYRALAPKVVSVVIPTRGTQKQNINESLVVNLAKSLSSQELEKLTVELVIVYDVDVDTTYLQKLSGFPPNIKIILIPYTPPFNFSSKSNLGAKSASGEVIIFLNDDTEFITKDAVVELAGTAMLNGVGAVGAKLFFENGSIQHAGTVVIEENLGHAYFKQNKPKGFFGDLTTVHEVSAVTGACIAQRKAIWQELNGWNEILDNSYNDVDYCFKLRELGYSIIQNNQVELYHFESLTRDASFSPVAKEFMEETWSKYLVDDPYFPQYVSTQKRKLKLRQMVKLILNKVRSKQ